MLNARVNSMNKAKASYIFHRHYHHPRLHKPKTKKLNTEISSSLRPPHRRPIPFLHDVKELRDPSEALSLFHKYHEMGFKHGYPSYSALIYKLAKSRCFKEIEDILDYIRDNDIRCQETLFIALIQHYGKAKSVEKAVELFHNMGSFNCTRTHQSLNAILNVLVDNDMLLDADELFRCSYKLALRPNAVSYNIIIKGRLKKGDVETAHRVFDEMLEKGITPSVVTYNSFVGFFCRKGDVEEGLALVDDMRKKRKYPNAVTYALLMEGLCFIGKYKEAKNLMFDMEYRGCKPGLVNFGVLMSDLGKRGMIDEAKSLLGEMKKKHIKPDLVTYCILINYMCKDDRVAEAYKFLVEMQVKGYEPNAVIYRTIVDAFLRLRDFDGSLKVLCVMLNSGYCPRSDSFCSLVMGLLREGNIDGACFVLEEMDKRNMGIDLESWETIVREACGTDPGAEILPAEVLPS